MGAQEVLIMMGQVIGTFLVIWGIGTMGASIFIDMQNVALSNDASIKADVVASSMNIIQMHAPSEINMQWDYAPFLMSTTDGVLMTLFFENKTIIPPYPLVLKIEGSERIGDADYFVGNQISNFKFSNYGVPEVEAV